MIFAALPRNNVIITMSRATAALLVGATWLINGMDGRQSCWHPTTIDIATILRRCIREFLVGMSSFLPSKTKHNGWGNWVASPISSIQMVDCTRRRSRKTVGGRLESGTARLRVDGSSFKPASEVCKSYYPLLAFNRFCIILGALNRLLVGASLNACFVGTWSWVVLVSMMTEPSVLL